MKRERVVFLLQAGVVAGLLALVMPSQGEHLEHLGWQDLRPDPYQATTMSDPFKVMSSQFEGKSVRIDGYLVPIKSANGQSKEFMLLASGDRCSHMGALAANQMIRVVPSDQYSMQGAIERVAVYGELHENMETAELFLLDGLKNVEAGYAMKAGRIVRDANSPVIMGGNPWQKLQQHTVPTS